MNVRELNELFKKRLNRVPNSNDIEEDIKNYMLVESRYIKLRLVR